MNTMSMFAQIETIVNASVQVFVKEISKKFKLNEKDVMQVWTSLSSKSSEVKKSPVKKPLSDSESDSEDDTPIAKKAAPKTAAAESELNKLTIKDLKEKLADLGVTEGVSGKTKKTLVEMILSKGDSAKPAPKSPVKSLKTSKVVEKTKDDSESEEEEEKPKTKAAPKSKAASKATKEDSDDEEKEEKSKKIVSKTVKASKEKKKEDSDDEEEEKSTTSSKKSSPSGSCTCRYEFTKPPRSGELCGIKVRDGGEFCSKHKKAADKSPSKEKASMPKPKSADDKKADNDEGESKKVVIKLNREIGKYWHPDTGFVFKSPEDKVVIGHLRDGVVNPLTSTQKTKCNAIGFPVSADSEEHEIVEKKTSPPAKKGGSVLAGISLSAAKTDSASKGKLGSNVKKLGEEVKSMAAALSTSPKSAADDDDDIEKVLAEIQEDDEELIEDDE
jgi:hypothetical protein